VHHAQLDDGLLPDHADRVRQPGAAHNARVGDGAAFQVGQHAEPELGGLAGWWACTPVFQVVARVDRRAEGRAEDETQSCQAAATRRIWWASSWVSGSISTSSPSGAPTRLATLRATCRAPTAG
jgi:hypothetical protein